jgi:hypothetical protein
MRRWLQLVRWRSFVFRIARRGMLRFSLRRPVLFWFAVRRSVLFWLTVRLRLLWFALRPAGLWWPLLLWLTLRRSILWFALRLRDALFRPSLRRMWWRMRRWILWRRMPLRLRMPADVVRLSAGRRLPLLRTQLRSQLWLPVRVSLRSELRTGLRSPLRLRHERLRRVRLWIVRTGLRCAGSRVRTASRRHTGANLRRPTGSAVFLEQQERPAAHRSG